MPGFERIEEVHKVLQARPPTTDWERTVTQDAAEHETSVGLISAGCIIQVAVSPVHLSSDEIQYIDKSKRQKSKQTATMLEAREITCPKVHETPPKSLESQSIFAPHPLL